jgi:hypothetical protein
MPVPALFQASELSAAISNLSKISILNRVVVLKNQAQSGAHNSCPIRTTSAFERIVVSGIVKILNAKILYKNKKKP